MCYKLKSILLLLAGLYLQTAVITGQTIVKCAVPDQTPTQVQAVTDQINQYLSLGKSAVSSTLYISVAAHIVRYDNATGDITDAKVQEQIDVLNAGYSATNYRFTLKSIDRTNNSAWTTHTYGTANETNMKNSLSISPANVMNLYFCANPKSSSGSSLLGYATFPWAYSETSKMHGIVVKSSTVPGGSETSYNQGKTATHEVGHYLGLYHTFQNGCSSPGDAVDDTPYEESPAYGCQDGRNTCTSAGNDPVHNFMDYSDDPCLTEFSAGQSARMDLVVPSSKPGLFVKSITVTQVNSSGVQVGSVSRWNGSAFQNVTLGTPYTVNAGSTEVLKGEQTIISNEKYNIWQKNLVDESNVRNHHEFIVDGDFPYKSKLIGVSSASLKVKLDGIDYPTGSVKFKDPWLIDFSDATYGSIMRNRGMSDALLTPVTSADNNLGTGSSFKGIFKNLDPINPQVTTYYKIQSDNTETFGSQLAYFQNWSATGATVTNTTSGGEQPVVFTADNAVVTGNYKGHLRTGVPNNSDAKNQRRVVSSTTSTNNLQMIYESMGEVWFTVSSDNGATWSKEVRLSSGNGTAKNPTFSNMIRYKKTDGTFASGPERLVAAWVEGTDIHLQTLMDFDWLGWISYPAGSSVQTSDNHRVLSSLGIIGSQPRTTGSRPVLNYRQSGNNIILTVAYEGQNTGIIGTTVVFTGNGQNIVGDLSSAVTAPLASSLGGPDDLEITTGTTDEYPVIFNTPAVYGYPAKEAIYYLGAGYASGRRVVEYNTSTGSKTLLSTAYGDYTYTYLQGAVSAENATAALVAGAQVNDANGTHYNVNLYGKATYTTGVPSLSTTYTNYTQATVAVQPNSGFGAGTPTNQIYMKNTSTNVWYKANGATTIGSNVSGFYLPERFSALASLNSVVNRTAVNGVAATPSVLERYQNSTVTQLNKTNSSLAINVRGFRFFTPINQSEQMTILDFSGAKVEIIDSLESGKLLVAVKVLETSDNGVIVSQNDSLQVSLSVDVVRGGNTIRSYSASEWSALTSQSIGGLESGDILLFRLPFNVSSSWGYEEVNFGETALAKENTDEKEGSELKAKEFSVSAYPNPFNPQTTFRITLPNIQFVTLEVYNMLGQRVQTLVNGKLEAGEHNFQFNGTNLSTGTYIYRLSANDKVQSGKIVLMK